MEKEINQNEDQKKALQALEACYSWSLQHLPWEFKGHEIMEADCIFGTGISDSFEGIYSLEELSRHHKEFLAPFETLETLQNYQPSMVAHIQSLTDKPEQQLWILDGIKDWLRNQVTKEYMADWERSKDEDQD